MVMLNPVPVMLSGEKMLYWQNDPTSQWIHLAHYVSPSELNGT